MDIEEQVVSLDLAKKLKELGVEQESLYRWQNPFNNDYWEPTALKKSYIEENNSNPENYSAFTVAELGDILPVYIESNEHVYEIIMNISGIEYRLDLDTDELVIERPRLYQIGHKPIAEYTPVKEDFFYEDKSEANARAKLLIHLIENGLYKP